MTKVKKSVTNQHKMKKPIKKSEAAVLKKIANSEGLLNAIGDGISILDRNFKILYQNEAEKNMMGDHVGEKCYKAYSNRKSICRGCPVAITFRDGKVHTVPREIQTDQKKRYAEITASPIRDSSGKIIAGIEVVRDTTERWTTTLRLKESEKLFSCVLNALDGLLVVLNKDLQIIYSNWKDHDFVSEKEKQGNPYCYKVFKHFESPCDYCPSLKTFTDGKSRTYEDRNPVDGSFKEIYVSPVTDDRGNVLFVIEYVQDITDRKQFEEELSLSEEKFRSLFEQAGDYALLLNPTSEGDLVIVEANEAACQMHGYTRDELVGMSVSKLDPKLTKERISERLQSLLSGETMKFEAEHKRKDGTSFHLEVCTKAVEIPGSPLLIFSTERDITDRKRAEKEIHEKVKELEEFYNIAIGRELRMKELKEQIEELEKELAKYKKQ